MLFAATGKRAKYDSAPSTLPIGPLLSRKQDKCAYFSASCGGERCVYVRLLGADSKNFEKGSPLSFFSVGWGRVWQRLCVCVCVQGVLCGLSFRFCVRSDQIKKFEMESPPRRKRRRAHTHNTYRERERVPTLRCCISVGTTRVCVRARVCSDVPFAVDFSLSQIGKMVLALLDRGGCCCCCLLQPKGKTQQTGNKQETNTQKQRRLVTQDTRTYTTHTKHSCVT